MTHKIERLFQPVIGQQISGMYRYLGSQRFDIGPQQCVINRRGNEVWKSDTALILSCQWKIAGSVGHIVGSDDFGPGRERRDSAEAKAFYRLVDKEEDLIWIQGVEGKNDGSIHFTLNDNFTLTLLAEPLKQAMVLDPKEAEMRLLAFEDDELWRFMPNSLTNPGADSFVFTSDGIITRE